MVEPVQAELTAFDDQLAGSRDSLQSLKHDRDVLRAENTRLRSQSGVVAEPLLLQDMDAQKDRRALLRDQLSELKEYHTTMAADMKNARGKLTLMASQVSGISDGYVATAADLSI